MILRFSCAALPILGCAVFAVSNLPAAEAPPVDLKEDTRSVTLSNGTIEAVISKSGSTVTSMKLGAHELVSPRKPVYYSMGGGKSYRQPTGATFRIVKRTPDVVDVAFVQKWKPGMAQAVDIEVHYALKRGESGVHTYAILSHPADYPDSSVGEWRMVWGMPAKNDREWLMEKIRVDSLRNWEMPSPADLAKAKPTGIKEIVEITSGPRAGRFDCKYDFNLEYHSVGCWGHASDRNQVGAWIVLGSHEFFNDGPMKQDLSSASSLIHIHFGMNHYGGSSTRLKAGEAWRKIYGPFLLYGNQGGNADELWKDARAKAASERRLWPHAWVADAETYPPASARGSVRGSLVIRDPLKPGLSSAGAWVGLAQPKPGSNFQNDSNSYQYWTKTDAAGRFEIPHVRPGIYTLHAFANGVVGEFEQAGAIVKAGLNPAGEIVWNVPRSGKSLAWEIGVPDRRAAEFRGGSTYFQSYAWNRFSRDLPNPLVYQIGRSDPSKDWNYVQGGWMKDGKAVQWPWEIRFDLGRVPAAGKARLILAFASSDRARVEVRVNGRPLTSFLPPSGGGNALIRQGIHAKYGLTNLEVPVSLLKEGGNVITLTETRGAGAFSHVMYDYVALEMP